MNRAFTIHCLTRHGPAPSALYRRSGPSTLRRSREHPTSKLPALYWRSGPALYSEVAQHSEAKLPALYRRSLSALCYEAPVRHSMNRYTRRSSICRKPRRSNRRRAGLKRSTWMRSSLPAVARSAKAGLPAGGGLCLERAHERRTPAAVAKSRSTLLRSDPALYGRKPAGTLPRSPLAPSRAAC